MGILIRNGTVVTALDTWRTDVLCEDGKIAAIAPGLDATGHEVVEAGDRYVMPGGVDPHVHMALPFMGTVSLDDFESISVYNIPQGSSHLGGPLWSSDRYWADTARVVPPRCWRGPIKIGHIGGEWGFTYFPLNAYRDPALPNAYTFPSVNFGYKHTEPPDADQRVAGRATRAHRGLSG